MIGFLYFLLLILSMFFCIINLYKVIRDIESNLNKPNQFANAIKEFQFKFNYLGHAICNLFKK